MKAVFITRHGGPECLETREIPDPSPGPGEVLVRVEASGVNYADVMARRGLYPDAPKAPFVPGLEIAGQIQALGPGVERRWLGRPVLALTRFGAYASLAAVPLAQVFERPEGLDSKQAAAIPVNYLTAWDALVIMGSLKAGDRILIHNAGGGVGLASLQLARHIGAETFGTASAGKAAFLKTEGLDHYVNYHEKRWPEEVLNLSQGRGMDLILDPLGGSSWRKSLTCLAPSGRLAMYGVSSIAGSGLLALPSLLRFLLTSPWFHPIRLMNRNQGVLGLNLGHLWTEADRVRAWMSGVLRGQEEGWLQPRVHGSYPLEQAGAAQRVLEERQNLGKVVLIPQG